MEKRSFRSRVCALYVIIELSLFFALLISEIRLGNIPNIKFYISVGVAILFEIYNFSRKPYVLTNKHLLYEKWGFSSEICHLSHIISIERSHSDVFIPTFSSAKSLKKLRICLPKGYKWGYYMMSPVREQEFLETLKAINPDIQINVTYKKGWWRFWDWDF